MDSWSPRGEREGVVPRHDTPDAVGETANDSTGTGVLEALHRLLPRPETLPDTFANRASDGVTPDHERAESPADGGISALAIPLPTEETAVADVLAPHRTSRRGFLKAAGVFTGSVVLALGPDMLARRDDRLAEETIVPRWARPDVLSPVEQFLKDAEDDPRVPATVTVSKPDAEPAEATVNAYRDQQLRPALEVVILLRGGNPYTDGVIPMPLQTFDKLIAQLNQNNQARDVGKPTLLANQQDPATNALAGAILVNDTFVEWSGGDPDKPVTSDFFKSFFMKVGQINGYKDQDLTNFRDTALNLLKDWEKPRSETFQRLMKNSSYAKWIRAAAKAQEAYGLA